MQEEHNHDNNETDNEKTIWNTKENRRREYMRVKKRGYKTMRGAKMASVKSLNPSITYNRRLRIYDWYPHGHPFAPNDVRVSYWTGIKWADIGENI